MKKLTWSTSSLLGLSALALSSSLSTAVACEGEENRIAFNLEAKGEWEGYQSGQGQTPPMGWNTWYAFGDGLEKGLLSEEKMLNNAQAIKESGLQEAGYSYINLDAGWWLKRDQDTGRLVARGDLFPSTVTDDPNFSDFKPFVEQLHSLGFKAGMYSDIGRNICMQSGQYDHPNLPKGTVKEMQVGMYDYIESDIQIFFEEWGFDFLKLDACGIGYRNFGHPKAVGVRIGGHEVFEEPLINKNDTRKSCHEEVRKLFTQVSENIIKNNPDGDFVYSICSWGRANVNAWGNTTGNMWRTSRDMKPTWKRFLHCFDSASTRAIYAGPQTWNDPDMLMAGHQEFDETNLLEARTQMALWCMIKAPLMMSNNLPEEDERVIALLSDQKLIALNQDSGGHQATQVYAQGDLEVYLKRLEDLDKHPSNRVVAFFHRDTASVKDKGTQIQSRELSLSLDATLLKLKENSDFQLLPLDGGEALSSENGQLNLTLQPRECLLFYVQGSERDEKSLLLSEIPGRIHVAEDGITQLVAAKDINQNSDHPYFGIGGPRLDHSPYGKPLRVRKESYNYGIGTLSNARLQVKTEGKYSEFTAQVGMNYNSSNPQNSLVFAVYGDGKLLKQTQPIGFKDVAQELQANIEGVQILELVVRGLPDQGPSVACWGNATLTLP